ncbi:helix-turn-helix domain-containing protein [Streptomyces sp. NPDC051162]|uniref:helix-turn-helix domain-containing protein n=1 Tax=unclassified Streptomyces TaxID=2593676 RepID=UPI00341A4758
MGTATLEEGTTAAYELPGGLSGQLVRISAEGDWAHDRQRAEIRLARLAADGPAALVVAASSGPPQALVEATARLGIPLLTMSEDVPWHRVQRAVDDERLRQATGRSARLTELLELARTGTHDTDTAVRRLTAWLGDAVGGTVTLTGRCGTAPAAAGPQLVADLTEGRLHAAAVQEDHAHLRLVAVGRRPPHPVLAATRDSPFDEQSTALVNHAADVLALLIRARDAEEHRRRSEEAVSSLRLAVLQLLMGGDVVLAQRTAAPLHPGLLDAECADVYILEAPEGRREPLAHECEAAVDGRALLVRCPAYEQHLIAVVPLPGGAAARDERTDGVGPALRRIVAARDGVFLGGSGRHPLARTSEAYGEASRALAVARLRPDRMAAHAAQTRLTEILDLAAAGRWAAGVLRPLDSLPYPSRGPLLATVGLGLEFTAVNAARILGVSRNTVRARMDRVGGLLGLDLTDVRARAALHLALHAHGHGPAEPGPAVPLDGLLGTEGVRGWAAELLGRLAADDRELRRTLRAWIAENTGVERAAGRLGLHPQTVREHVRSAEPLLRRQLFTGGGDLYELVLALAAVDGTELPAFGGCSTATLL